RDENQGPRRRVRLLWSCASRRRSGGRRWPPRPRGRRSLSLQGGRRASTADPPHETKRGRVGRLGEGVRAIRELARYGVVSADKSLRHPAESLLELVRAV